LVEVEGFQEQIVKVLMLPVTWSTSAAVNSRAFWRLRTLLFSFMVFPFFGVICDCAAGCGASQRWRVIGITAAIAIGGAGDGDRWTNGTVQTVVWTMPGPLMASIP
jgi:hypothetical protein